MVQTHPAPTRQRHRPCGGDAEAGHDHLAHADQEEDVCRVSRTSGSLSGSKSCGLNDSTRRLNVKRFGNGSSIRSAPGGLRSLLFGAARFTPLMRRPRSPEHVALYGAPLTARNSPQINQHPPPPGGAARGNRQRRLAKECFGSNRHQKRSIATPRRDDNQPESIAVTPLPTASERTQAGDYANHYPYAVTPRENSVTRQTLSGKA